MSDSLSSGGETPLSAEPRCKYWTPESHGPCGVCEVCRPPSSYYSEYENALTDVRSHWFLQGGESQFGAIREASNPDEIVSQVLRHVRAALASAVAGQQRAELRLEIV